MGFLYIYAVIDELLIVVNISVVTNTKDTSTAKINEIKKRGYLTVGMTAVDQFPFYYVNDSGEIEGLDVDIAKEVAERIGVELRINRDAKYLMILFL